MNDIQQFWLAVVGGLIAMAVGLATVFPKGAPLIDLDPTFGLALFLAGLAVFGIGPVKTAYNSARASAAGK